MKAGRIALIITGSLAAAPRGRAPGRRRLGPQRQHRLGRLHRHRRPPSPDRHPRPRIRRPRRRQRLRLGPRPRPGAARQRREQQAALHRHRPHRRRRALPGRRRIRRGHRLRHRPLEARPPNATPAPSSPAAPASQTIWAASVAGNRPPDARLGRRRRRLVGRRHERRRQCGVDAELTFGAHIPHLTWIGIGGAVGGALFLLLAAGLIYLGAPPRTTRPARSHPQPRCLAATRAARLRRRLEDGSVGSGGGDARGRNRPSAERRARRQQGTA